MRRKITILLAMIAALILAVILKNHLAAALRHYGPEGGAPVLRLATNGSP